MLRFFPLLLVLFCVCLAHYCSAQDYVVPYDNVPITPKTWEEIDIDWPNSYDKTTHNTAQLLRPIDYAHRHRLIKGHHLLLNLTEFGVPYANITVTQVKPLTAGKVHQLHHDQQPVIGIYIHQTKDVRTYRFTDQQGKLSTVHATPNHPFYVTNLHAYVAISHITDTMPLDGRQHQPMYLVCPLHHHRHCGTPYRPHKIKTVYNLEIYQRHHYLVGKPRILVHNCNLGVAKNIKPIEMPELTSFDLREKLFEGGQSRATIYKTKNPDFLAKVIETPSEIEIQNLRNESHYFNRFYYENASQVYVGENKAIMFQRKIIGVPLNQVPNWETRLTPEIVTTASTMQRHGFAHGDLVESNILVSQTQNRNGESSYNVYFIDFGNIAADGLDEALRLDNRQLHIYIGGFLAT